MPYTTTSNRERDEVAATAKFLMRMKRSRLIPPVSQSFSVLIREEMAAADGNTKFDNEQDEEDGLVVEQNDDLQPNKKRVPRLIVRQVRAKSC
jgi:hypothetical protein